MKRLPALVVVGLLALALAIPISGRLGAPATPEPTLPPTGASPSAPGLAASPSAASTPSPSPSPSPTPVPLADVPVVPVTHFRATAERTTLDEVRAVLAGTSKAYRALELVDADAEAILAALGIDGATAAPDRLVRAPDAATLAAHLAETRDRLGFLRAGEVGPSVRALAWGDRALFGVDAVESAADWALTIRAAPVGPTGEPLATFDPAATWTLVAGGDILLDRGVAQTVKVNGKGVDFPFDGGTADITSRYCCSSFGWELPRVKRTGNEGAMRHLLSSADLAIANFENPAPDSFRYHTSGTVFTADPALIEGLANAGIDFVSIANNHIGDAGRNGILQTIDNLAAYGIASGGAGRNALAARRPTILDAGGAKVAILAYDTIAPAYRAGTDRPGSALLTAEAVESDVGKARANGAEVIIVFPHWGTEYDATPFAAQQALARASIDAGADMVIGNHAHWAAALEVYEGSPIWYALGNFVFDQTWSEPTMEGITLELTFQGAELVQARMRPHIILDKAQPNFLDPAGDGRVVLGQVYDASRGILPW